jgi:antitoxin component HigA of HigAB toxin-antitoxin module
MTDLKPIRSEEDYEAALAELGRLWAPHPAGPKATGSTCWRR